MFSDISILTKIYVYTHILRQAHIDIVYIYICVCVCTCMYVYMIKPTLFWKGRLEIFYNSPAKGVNKPNSFSLVKLSSYASPLKKPENTQCGDLPVASLDMTDSHRLMVEECDRWKQCLGPTLVSTLSRCTTLNKSCICLCLHLLIY